MSSPSLALFPCAYDAGKLYSVLPDTGAGDFTVSRNGTATYFDKDGLLKTAAADEPRFEFDPLTGDFKGVLVEPSATNLFQRSEDFANSYWAKNNVTISSNDSGTLAPNGTQTADKILTSVGTANMRIRIISQSSINPTVSIFAKAAGIRYMMVRFGGFSFSDVTFDLIDGIITEQESSIIFATITELENGWYRCSWSALRSFPWNFELGLTTSPTGNTATTTTIVGNGIDGIYVWGAQQEAGLMLTSYIPTVESTVTRPADVIDVTVPVGVTEIKETVNGVENTITSIPTTYQLPNGQISRVIMT
jgi:hypothetical protein